MFNESILNSVKKQCGLEADYEHFDPEIIGHINSILMVLNQIGVGPEEGFVVEDDSETWGDFLGDRVTTQKLTAVKTYVGLRVRLIFDPPGSSALIESMKRQADELEWRLNVLAETK
jgi:hypothetical protein